jgi:hypothetical protein
VSSKEPPRVWPPAVKRWVNAPDSHDVPIARLGKLWRAEGHYPEVARVCQWGALDYIAQHPKLSETRTQIVGQAYGFSPTAGRTMAQAVRDFLDRDLRQR